MELSEKLQYLISLDGPHISARRLSVYCGVSDTTIRNIAQGEIAVSEELQKQVNKGLKEMALEIYKVATDDS